MNTKVDFKGLQTAITEMLAHPDINIPPTRQPVIDPAEARKGIDIFRALIFNGYFAIADPDELMANFFALMTRLIKAVRIVFHHETPDEATQAAEASTVELLESLPELRRQLGTDVKAVFDGDPAASSFEEVILCYPGITAMVHYRLAHRLLLLGVPILPRYITEMAHASTGIDIHPGADIGDYFCIDHGTGVVIGETCIIGHHVKIYQGVTLGAKSFKFDADGNIINEPRHPVIGDNVVIYSNTSLLGRIHIGHDSIIGGNVWLTKSVGPSMRVLQSSPTVTTAPR